MKEIRDIKKKNFEYRVKHTEEEKKRRDNIVEEEREYNEKLEKSRTEDLIPSVKMQMEFQKQLLKSMGMKEGIEIDSLEGIEEDQEAKE